MKLKIGHLAGLVLGMVLFSILYIGFFKHVQIAKEIGIGIFIVLIYLCFSVSFLNTPQKIKDLNLQMTPTIRLEFFLGFLFALICVFFQVFNFP